MIEHKFDYVLVIDRGVLGYEMAAFANDLRPLWQASATECADVRRKGALHE